MLKNFLIYIQYIIPTRALSALLGCIAECRQPWLKNWLIRHFIHRYQVDMRLARIENPEAYSSFNDFFIRELKPNIRPIASGPDEIASPIDGTIAQIGSIQKNQLFQAKGFYFDLESLLGGDKELAQHFYHGSFATLYLAPYNYHRVHMPISGKLTQTIYIPGKLFSVNPKTFAAVPSLYSRNERLICLFDTPLGPMGLVMVGALIVGNIQMKWMQKPIKAKHIQHKIYDGNISFAKGDEIGHFKMGSTVILLYGEKTMAWSPTLGANSNILVGQLLGNIK